MMLATTPVLAQPEEDEECMMCHDDKTLFVERDGKRISMFIEYGRYAVSVHAEEGCTSCHADVDVDDLPHEEELEPVECDMCHDKAFEAFEASLHGKAAEKGRYRAPTCITCHGKHSILASENPWSPTHVSNVTQQCGGCHKEGVSVSSLWSVDLDTVQVMKETIHGDAFSERGLKVSPICTTCHGAHNVLSQHDPESPISRPNVVENCRSCHGQIPELHAGLFDRKVWDASSWRQPLCIDCHQPHGERRLKYSRSFPDFECVQCHGGADPSGEDATIPTAALTDIDVLSSSVHASLSCVSCHTNMDHAAEPVCVDSGPVDCSSCHESAGADFAISQHGTYLAEGDSNAPTCTDCHGSHDVLSKDDVNSPIFSRNVPDLCARCHREGEPAALAYMGTEHEIIRNYEMSIHGTGLLASGLTVTATCIDCHSAHRELPVSDSRSTVSPSNIATTCSACHVGILEEFRRSVHSPEVTQTDKKLPVCNDCHQSHTIQRVDAGGFREGILSECGDCHEEVNETYFQTFHGKVTNLGAIGTARCYDCHGSHDILPIADPASRLSPENIVQTCGSCHENSNPRFAQYLTHATHRDKDKYPSLHFAYVFMTTLLVSVFLVFGTHTILWLPRAYIERRKNRNRANNGSGGDD